MLRVMPVLQQLRGCLRRASASQLPAGLRRGPGGGHGSPLCLLGVQARAVRAFSPSVPAAAPWESTLTLNFPFAAAERSPDEAELRRKKRRRERRKRNKKSGKPKQARSAYVYFFKERIVPARQQVQASARVPLMFEEVTPRAARMVGEQWRNLSTMEKQRFEQMAVQDRRRYDTEMEVWRAAQPPSRPPSGYALFVGKNMARARSAEATVPGGHADVEDAMRALAREWNSMSDMDKMQYKNAAAQAKREYDAAMAEYRRNQKDDA